ncbi:MAG: type II toxin-antitoxin system VapC family toxin [Pseudonocardiaceae bacterium]
MTYLLDTSVLSDTRKRRRNPGLTDWISTTPSERLHVSVLTIGEIGRGVTRLIERGDGRQAAMVEGWLDDVVEEFGERIIPVSVHVAREWGRQRGAQPVPVIDALIAATATVHGWTLVTRNTKDFDRTGTRLLNPFTD